MNYNAFYLDGNILVRCLNKETTSYEKKENISVLYYKDEVIGYNIFDFDMKLENGIVTLTTELNEKINERLTQINEEALTIDETDYLVVGYVDELEKHRDSVKLNICQVDLGSEKTQIVCGAANVAQGQKVVVAKVGTVLFDGTWLKKGKLLGVESNGMICSAKELGLAKESQGILVLEADKYQVGETFAGLK